jgi:AraC family transcriptional regulator
VLEHIDGHLDGDLTVDRLSGIAAFSKYHFHRQFSELFGISVYKYVQLVRLKRASYELAFRDQSRIIDIALTSGYESHEAFSRAFKKAVGQTPSEFREQPQWEPWHATYQPLSELRKSHMKPEHRAENVKIVVFEETRVACLEHRGDPRRLGDSVRRFIEWRKQNNLPPRVSATFNILYDDPAETPAERFRLDICAATQRGVAENPFGIVEKTIPGGRCAVLRHVGSDDTLGEAINYLYATWLPASGEEPRDFPLYLQRVKFFPDVPEHEAVIDLFLPIR